MDAKDSITVIERLEDERYAAMLGKDIDALGRLLHPDLIYMHSSGVSDTKASYIGGLVDGTWDYRRIERSDQIVRVHGDLAFVFNRIRISIVIRGIAKELDNRALAVWVAEGGARQLIALQSGAVPPPPA